MNRAAVELEPAGDGSFAVKGVLGFQTAAKLVADSRKLFDGQSTLRIDLEGVQQADSAGLAVLIEWLSWARQSGARISFVNVPEQIRAIARISELEDLLNTSSG